MAMPDVSFTNNLGTLTFKRCLLDVADEWQWDGRRVVHRKRVGVEAFIKRDESERIEGVCTTGTAQYGRRGTLTLPWTVLKDVRLEGVDVPPNQWTELLPVSASFVDDLPSNNLYTLHFFGLELHNPRLAIPIPVKATTDNYLQNPFDPKGAVDASNPWYGPIRYRAGFSMMAISLSGTMLLPGGELPQDLVEKLQQRVGVGSTGNGGDLPDGYPNVFSLGEAIPELKSSLSMTNVFVARAQVNWSVSRQSARVMVTMAAQPQAWGEV